MVHATQNVAFIGTGNMGSAMAANLLEAGYPVTVFSRTPRKCARLVERGAVLARDAAQAARKADVVITMVGYPEEVEELYLAKGGLLESAKPGAYLIDMTTSDPALAVDIAQAAEVMGKHAFDAPVTGGQQGAADATLTMFCGATEEQIDPVRDVLATLATNVVAFGEPGKGQMAKLANQTALAGCMLGLAEGLAFAKEGGLDLRKTFQALMTGTAASAAMASYGPKILDEDYKPGFRVEHYVKDLGLILQTAEEEELTLPGVETANELFNMLASLGGSKMGVQAVNLVYADEDTCVAHGLDWSGLGDEEDGDEEGSGECGCGCDHDHDHHGHDHHEHGEACGCGCHDDQPRFDFDDPDDYDDDERREGLDFDDDLDDFDDGLEDAFGAGPARR